MPKSEKNGNVTLQKFKTADGAPIEIVFDTNTKIPTATVTKGDFKSTLKQTEAWAKCAEYEKDGTKLRMQDNNGTLEINDEKFEITLQ